MTEKVKLPDYVCDWLDNLAGEGLLEKMALIVQENNVSSEVGAWLDTSMNQLEIVKALANGYEREGSLKPRWGIKAGNCYLVDIANWSFNTTSPETLTRYGVNCWLYAQYPDEIVALLGFGKVVDLNKESEDAD
jgi:hypothetical protein